jgi:hypothetical protein
VCLQKVLYVPSHHSSRYAIAAPRCLLYRNKINNGFVSDKIDITLITLICKGCVADKIDITLITLICKGCVADKIDKLWAHYLDEGCVAEKID